MNSFLKMFRQAFVLAAVLLVLCSVAYPLALTGVSQLAFHKQANGSMIEKGGVVVGSELIGQDFKDSRFFRGRVSSVNYNTYDEGDTEYGGVASGSFNYAPSNPALTERVNEDIKVFLAANPEVRPEEIPADLLTASGSGLDPHITPESARLQVEGVSAATQIPQTEVLEIIARNTTTKVLGVLGEETVNVLMVNLEVAKKLGLLSQ